jgi:hypothetical protein
LHHDRRKPRHRRHLRRRHRSLGPRRGLQKVETVPGRCGNAIHIYELREPGRVRRTFEGVPLPKNTRLRLRAWFKKGSGPTLTFTPQILLRFYGPDGDGGTVETDYESAANVSGEFRLTERVITLTADQTAFDVFIDAYLETGTVAYDYLVDDISLVVEPP